MKRIPRKLFHDNLSMCNVDMNILVRLVKLINVEKVKRAKELPKDMDGGRNEN